MSNIIVNIIALLVSLNCAVMEIKKRTVISPDGEIIEIMFGKNTAPIKELLDNSIALADTDIIPVHPFRAYQNIEKNVFIILYPTCDYFLMFENKGNYTRYLKGTTYYRTGVFFKADSIFVSFSLNSEFSESFWKAESVNAYPDVEGYKVYKDIDNHYFMLRRRTKILTDGYMYPTIADFEYCYNSFK